MKHSITPPKATRPLLALVIAAIASIASASASEPFGVAPGAPVSALDVIDSGKYYHWVEVPDPHPEFEKYMVHATPGTGACLVRAIGRDYKNDGTGKHVRRAFDRLRNQLALKYGESTLNDFSRSWSFRDPGEEWVSELREDKLVHQAVWSDADGSDLPADLVEILLTVDTRRSGKQYWSWIHPEDKNTAYLELQYRFANYERCQLEIADEEEQEFRNEADAL